MNDLFALAERQYGVVTRTQARACGLTDRQVEIRLASGALVRVHPGVYRIPGSFPSMRQRAMAAVLWCGTNAVLSHGTAASLFRLPVAEPGVIHVTAPHRTRRASPLIRLHRTTDLEGFDRYEVDGLPCTSPVRTIVDLAADTDGEELEYLFEAARRLGLVTKNVLVRRVASLARRGRSGSRALRDLMRVIEGRPMESRLEVRAARLLRRHRVKPEARQHAVERFRIDFAWPSRMLGVECDGFEWHGNRLSWKRDRRRIARLETLGWRIVHVTWADVSEHADETIGRVREALASSRSLPPRIP